MQSTPTQSSASEGVEQESLAAHIDEILKEVAKDDDLIGRRIHRGILCKHQDPEACRRLVAPAFRAIGGAADSTPEELERDEKGRMLYPITLSPEEIQEELNYARGMLATAEDWQARMAGLAADFVAKMKRHLDEAETFAEEETA
jgi:hypothetical protein